MVVTQSCCWSRWRHKDGVVGDDDSGDGLVDASAGDGAIDDVDGGSRGGEGGWRLCLEGWRGRWG
jgi:hypothetical protein